MTEKFYYENDDRLDVLYRLNEYADRTPSFNNKFLDGCTKQLERNGYLSENQLFVLDEIYSNVSNKILVDEYNMYLDFARKSDSIFNEL